MIITAWINRALWATKAGLVIVCAGSGAVSAQTLDQEYELYLANKCSNLGFERDGLSNILPGQAGPNMLAYCDGLQTAASQSPGTSVTTNATGGAAGAAAGRDRGAGEEAALRRRREQLRDGESDAPAASGADLTLLTGSDLGIFLSMDFQRERQEATQFEAGRDADRWGMVLGMDYRITPTAIIGLAVNYSDMSGDFVGGGNFDKKNRATLFYGSWFPRDGMFVDLSLGAEDSDQNTRRIVGRRIVVTTPTDTFISFSPPLTPVTGSSDSRALSTELRGGYDFLIGEVTLGPRLGLAQRKTKLDGYTESGATPMALRFDNQSEKSQLSSLGLQVGKAFSLSSSVLALQLNIDWLHEFKDDQRTLTAQFAEDLRPNPTQLNFLNQPPDRNWYDIRISTVAVFPGGLSGFVSLQSTFGHDYLDQYSASIGLRQEF